MKNLSLTLCMIGVLLLTSCAKIYHSPDAKSRTNQHRMIAILPPKVSIEARKKVDAAAMVEQQKTESENFQKEMYSWMLKRKMQNKIRVEIMDVGTTNAKLAKLGDAPMTPAEYAEALGVDGVITSNYALSKPMSEGAALALGVIAGFWGTTNQTAVTLEIHDREKSKLLWNFNHQIAGTVGSTPASLVDALMRKASKKMPYIIE